MSRFRRYKLKKPLCPQCGSGWRPWWFLTNVDPFRPSCDHRFHTLSYPYERHRTNAPMPIPDGRRVLGPPDERRARRVRRHRQHQSKARR